MDNKTILGITIFILIGSVVVFSFTFAQNRSLTPCVKDWDTSSTPEQIKCIEQIGGYRQIQETRSALQEQTVQARPSSPPGSGLQTETALFQTVGLPEPTPTPNATEVQAALTKITPVERRLFTGGGTIPTLDYRYMASIWRVGAMIVDTTIIVPIFMSTSKEGCQVVVVRRRTPAEQTEVQNPQVTADTLYLQNSWSCPENIGTLTIANVTGPTGVITFTDTLSRTITFDLDTEAWTLEGEPWLPAATPTP